MANTDNTHHWTGSTHITYKWKNDRKWHTVSEINEQGSDPVPVAKFVTTGDAMAFAKDLVKRPMSRWLFGILVE